jgi:hypothetical protein
MALFIIKQQVGIFVGVKARSIDDFTYVFVRNLLHEDSDMLTT